LNGVQGNSKVTKAADQRGPTGKKRFQAETGTGGGGVRNCGGKRGGVVRPEWQKMGWGTGERD